jgi:DNA-binding SARP family transcriptional activator
VDFSILGPIEVWSGSRAVPVSGAKRRALLGLLVVNANRAVKADALIEHVWGSSAPDAAAATLQSHVSQLRKVLDPGRLSSRPGGYLLHVDDGELDATAFESEVAAGRSALRAGDAAGAARLFEQALARWRGPALTDAGDGVTVRAEASRLEELRLIAMESQLEARLALGQYADVARVAEGAVAEHPLRERLWAQLMVGLYRGGRQAEALQAYQRLRHHLGEELGIDPSPELRALEESILRHDQTLAPRRPAPPPETRHPAALPSGVVTFVLTDVVGSSRLWDKDPDAMAVALARHDEIIASAVGRHRGVLLKARGEGDSTFAVFQRATDAVAAAITGQRALVGETWPPDTPVSVRMALHTGEALERDGDYYGPTVNRVARLRALAGGGQVLLSQATATVVRDGLPNGVELVDLGQQELRDLTRLEMVYGLTGEGLGPVVPLTGGAGTVVPGEVVIPLPPRLADLPETGFVGRTFERDLVIQRAKEVHDGGRRVVLVSGEPGIGKTRLSAQGARAALDAGLIVLYGRADEDLGLPYQPFVESLDHLVRHAPSALLEAHVVRHGGDLARLVPSLRYRLPHLPPPQRSDPETERYLLFGAVVGLLGAASAMAPVLLVLDDLHWADRPTVQMLRYLIAAPEPLRTLIVASYRDSDLSAGHPMTDLLATLRREPRVERVSLKGLEDTELVDLMEHLSGRELDTSAMAFAQGLRRETDGNPFFVTEILRDLTESGALPTDEGGWVLSDQSSSIRLPDSVREVVGQRVARLGDTAVKVLSAAAVIGHDFDLGVLAAAVDLEDELVVDTLDLAAEANLVTSTGPGRLSFAHALIEHSLYEGLTSARKARLHRRVAVALEEIAGDEAARVGELAYHWAQATQPTDLDKAVDYAYQAGRRALAHLAPDEAARWFDQAIELLGDTPGPLHCDLMTALGEAKRQTGDAGFRETLLQAADEAGALGDPARMTKAVLANSRGFFAASGVVDVERIGHLEAALAAVGDGDSAERARLLARLASELSYSGDPRRRRHLSDDALAVARRIGDPVTLAHVLRERNEAIAPPDMLDEKLDNTAELVALADRLGDPVVRFWALYWRAITALQDGKYHEFEERLDRISDLAAAIGQPTLRWTVAWVSSVRALLVGDAAGAEALALEALQLGNDTGQPDAVAIFGGQLLEIRHHQGRSAELVGLIAQTVVDNPGIPAFRAALARAQCYAGQEASDEARRALLEAASERFAGLPYDVVWLTGMALWAQVAVSLDEPGPAAVLSEVLRPFRDQIALVGPVCQGVVVEALGELAAVEGRTADAIRLLGEAEDLYQSIPAPFYLAKSRLHRGRLLLASGTSEDAELGVRLLTLANRAAADGGFAVLEHETAAALAGASG